MAEQGDLRALRREYQAEALLEADVARDPIDQFERWFEQALTLQPDNANAMVLATASADGCPSARVVLLKHFDSEGFCWYTDYRSQKGQELSENPQAELLFYWPELERQVRIWGPVARLDHAAAEHYFAARPRGSQISASVSRQSAVVAGREDLVAAAMTLEEQYQHQSIPCPADWGGYQLRPERMEFWQGRENRLHDRLVYGRQLQGWQLVRLAP
ncbi:pyridoxamine 5'-phosphate oxidase [Motiliproteus sediminis]|uniref:pyridoxamine 5'-phosphate oxidase n=1 Tax=Motiliproteus sediminis TaxID=1468178 RepID=UPI001AF02167|nr:pyridoxamine 5'-phosphate oxidase [Motiliproteus sediminis]